MRRRLIAALYDTVSKGSEAAGMREERRQLLASTEGATIEIGAGTGLNLEHYPEAVTRLVLAEPDRHMRRRLRQRVDPLERATEVIDASAERLPFPDATFDSAVVTLVLCSVPNQEVALAEIARVLKPNGASSSSSTSAPATRSWRNGRTGSRLCTTSSAATPTGRRW